MIKSKKAALNLSITAIVILILAITILGLGLAFISNVFSTATEQFDEVKGDARKQMINLMEEKDDVVALSRSMVDIKPGQKKQIFIAFKNTGDDDETFDPITVSGYSLKGESTNCGDSSAETYLEFKIAPTTVSGRDVVVLPINIVAESPINDICYFEITSTHGTSSSEKIALTVEIVWGENDENTK